MENYLNQSCPKCQKTNYFQINSLIFMGGELMEIDLEGIECWDCYHIWSVCGGLESPFVIDRGLECLDC